MGNGFEPRGVRRFRPVSLEELQTLDEKLVWKQHGDEAGIPERILKWNKLFQESIKNTKRDVLDKIIHQPWMGKSKKMVGEILAEGKIPWQNKRTH